MIDTWDLSLLIDHSTKIHDARGMTAQHFGVAVRDITERPFIDFVIPEQRAAFRRCMARITGGREMGLTAAKLLTCEPEPRQFYLLAKRSSEPERWWLMIAADNANSAASAEQMATAPVLADDDEFIAMVEGAADQLDGRVDMMRVASSLLSGKKKSARTTRAVKDKLETQFTKIVLDNAFDGIATRPGPGEYMMLKDRETPAGEIVHQLEEAAQQLDVSRADLGLETASFALDKLGLDKLGRDIRAAKIVRVMSDLVEDGRGRRDDWGEPMSPRKPWVKPAMAAALGSVALLGLLLLLV
jgi:hypothetical protein